MDNLESDINIKDSVIVDTVIKQEKDDDPNAFISYVTGLDPTSENFSEQLIDKRDSLREQYDMPDAMAVFNGDKTVSQYYEELIQRANKEGVEISFDLEEYIKKNNLPEYATGVFSEDIDEKIHVKGDFDKNDGRKIRILEHELVHAIQFKYSPKMSAEQKEYEAYLIANSSRMILRSPFARDMLFGLMHSASKYQYDIKNQKPPWKN